MPGHPASPPRRRPPAYAHRVFFPMAALYGALAVPLWIAGYAGWPPLGWTPAVHAHEMIAGYALAVVGGFLMTRLSRPALALAVAAWLAGRAAMLTGAPPGLAVPATLAYPLLLFAIAGVPFLRAAKSGHNAVFGPLIGAFALAEGLFWAGWLGVTDGQRGVPVFVALVGMLMLGMGGRVIPAATAGAVRDRGGLLERRVQPALEWAGLAGAAVAVLTAATGVAPALWTAGALLAGGTALARLARWRTAAVLDRPDLWSLHLGYLLLGLGWIEAGLQPFLRLPGGMAWHVLGIGGMAILITAMMVRATCQREAEPVRFPPAATTAVVLLALAAVLRLTPGLLPIVPALAAAAGAWTAAHLLTLWTLLATPRRAPVDRRG